MALATYILRRMAALAAAIAMPAGFCAAGAVATPAGTVAGKVALGDGRLLVDGQAVAWKDVIHAALDPAGSAAPQNSVRMANGEIWPGEIVSLSSGRLKVHSRLFGQKEIDLAAVSSLDFQALPAPMTAPPEATLYRPGFEPIPGSLLWVDAGELAIDSPLGVLTLDRGGCSRYSTARPAVAADAQADRVVLIDGGIFHGRATLTAAGVQMEHPVLGRLSLPAAAVAMLWRGDGSATLLSEAAPKSVRAPSLIGLEQAPRTVWPIGPGHGAPGKAAMLGGIRIEPRTTITYAAPAGRGKSVRLIGSASADGKGQVVLRISAGGRQLAALDLLPGERAASFDVLLPAGEEFTIDVDFGRRIAFPAAAVLRDPVLLAAPPKSQAGVPQSATAGRQSSLVNNSTTVPGAAGKD